MCFRALPPAHPSGSLGPRSLGTEVPATALWRRPKKSCVSSEASRFGARRGSVACAPWVARSRDRSHGFLERHAAPQSNHDYAWQQE
jgi:hypothetical protein